MASSTAAVALETAGSTFDPNTKAVVVEDRPDVIVFGCSLPPPPVLDGVSPGVDEAIEADPDAVKEPAMVAAEIEYRDIEKADLDVYVGLSLMTVLLTED